MRSILRACTIAVLVTPLLALPIYAQGSLKASVPNDPGPPMFVVGDPVIYDNGVTENTGLASQLDTAYPFDAQAADDFSLPTGSGLPYDVTGISFRGLYFNNPPSGPSDTTFNIIFYNDAGGTPPGGPSDPTGSAIAVRTAGGVGITTGGTEEWDWSLTFAPVVLSPDTTYWVAVQWVGVFPPQFGWAGDNTGGNGQQGFPLIAMDYWTPVQTEMLFQLHGTQEEIPVELQEFVIE